MKRKLSICLLVFGSSFAAANAADGGPYLCIVDKSTGFSFDKVSNNWKSTNFLSGKKLIIKRVVNEEKEPVKGIRTKVPGVWAVWEFGNDNWPAFTCAADFTDVGVLWCDNGASDQFAFNRKNQRFISAYLVGFIQVGIPAYMDLFGKENGEGSDTPAVSIGTCSSL